MTEQLLALVGTGRKCPPILTAVTKALEFLRPEETVVITSENTGTDLHVRRECKRLGLRFIACYADKSGDRNAMIVRLAHSLVAWPMTPGDTEASVLESAATWDCVERFKAKGKTVVVMDSAWAQR